MVDVHGYLEAICSALSALYPKPVKLPAAESGIGTRGVILYLAFAYLVERNPALQEQRCSSESECVKISQTHGQDQEIV